MLIIIRGGGDLATGVALRLYRGGMDVAVCETPAPTSIRRTVCFSEAVRLGETVVEDVTARRRSRRCWRRGSSRYWWTRRESASAGWGRTR